MTIPAYSGLDTALSGLEAAQAAIDTTGQNISNANTPGYTREQVDLSSASPLTIPATSNINGGGAQLGTGVDISNITRSRDQFLDASYRTQNTATSAANTQSGILTQAQAALNEPSSDGLSTTLQGFWSSFNSLSNDPSNAGVQESAVGSGQELASTLNSLSSQLTTLQSQVTSQYNALTDPSTGAVASDANQIAQINGEIAAAQTAGTTPNTLLDQRDQLIDDLSQYSNVNVTTQPNGMVNVSFGNAAAAAAGGTPDATPLVDGTKVNLSQNLTDSNLSGSSGTLGALLGLYDSTTGQGQLQGYMNTLNSVANDVVTTVNGAISGADSAGATATPFFNPADVTAATISVNSAVTPSSSNPPYTGAEASAVANLAGGTADTAYNAFVTQVGSDVQSVQNAQSTQQSLLTAITSQRESADGVSIDEEMTNLITYQQAYQASARVMNAINDTFSSLLSAVGGGI